ncbi:DsbE family thiol:disulfide interchange protein [Cognatishimia maritima]|uniref:Cytochrome c biogenesis protein CcmG, thiol:disulfide interchange protein DsbE n=1 Tax=Cognatishimia maritima TaxID=870908 RepID=A0A1M5JMI0_9RHOB|nr:DsbE family thiol:disulfide interchange protein [Cognatishimia maritima]SHG41470.1 cytochrome c biogenesis protein CcmG, thiol:disulfide interchange protein DsbE [Cognatishimia maritima]
MAKVSPLMMAPPAIFAGLAALFFFGMQRENPDELPSAMVGRDAPPVVIEELGYLDSFTDADLRKGELTLVNFWASWCAPCRAEHPTLMQLQDEGIKIMGVNYKDNAQNGADFLEELGNPFAKGGADPNGKMALNWGVYGVPETYLVDGDGKVLVRIAGPLVQRELQNRLRPILDAQ